MALCLYSRLDLEQGQAAFCACLLAHYAIIQTRQAAPERVLREGAILQGLSRVLQARALDQKLEKNAQATKRNVFAESNRIKARTGVRHIPLATIFL